MFLVDKEKKKKKKGNERQSTQKIWEQYPSKKMWKVLSKNNSLIEGCISIKGKVLLFLKSSTKHTKKLGTMWPLLSGFLLLF